MSLVPIEGMPLINRTNIKIIYPCIISLSTMAQQFRSAIKYDDVIGCHVPSAPIRISPFSLQFSADCSMNLSKLSFVSAIHLGLLISNLAMPTSTENVGMIRHHRFGVRTRSAQKSPCPNAELNYAFRFRQPPNFEPELGVQFSSVQVRTEIRTELAHHYIKLKEILL